MFGGLLEHRITTKYSLNEIDKRIRTFRTIQYIIDIIIFIFIFYLLFR